MTNHALKNAIVFKSNEEVLDKYTIIFKKPNIIIEKGKYHSMYGASDDPYKCFGQFVGEIETSKFNDYIKEANKILGKKLTFSEKRKLPKPLIDYIIDLYS